MSGTDVLIASSTGCVVCCAVTKGDCLPKHKWQSPRGWETISAGVKPLFYEEAPFQPTVGCCSMETQEHVKQSYLWILQDLSLLYGFWSGFSKRKRNSSEEVIKSLLHAFAWLNLSSKDRVMVGWITLQLSFGFFTFTMISLFSSGINNNKNASITLEKSYRPDFLF